MNEKTKEILELLAPALWEIALVIIAVALLLMTKKYDFMTWYIIGVPAMFIVILILILIIIFIVKIAIKLKNQIVKIRNLKK